MESSLFKPTQLRILTVVSSFVILCACIPALFAQRNADPRYPTPEEIIQTGYRAYYDHDWVTAINAYRSVMAIPGHATAENYFMLILSQLYGADYANTVADGENFLATFQNSEYVPYVRYHIGRAYYLMGNYVNAAYYLTEFCHAYPGHELYASALYWIAECFFSREQYTEARGLYERIVRDFPQDAKHADAQARIEAISWFSRTESQIKDIRNDVAGLTVPSVSETAPAGSPKVDKAKANKAIDQQREFVNSLLVLSAQLNEDKDLVMKRLEITGVLITRNTAGEPATQWTPEQQRFIADLLSRVATQTNWLTTRFASDPDSTDQVERILAELLTKNAELAYQQAPLSEREKYIADLNTLNRRLLDEKSRIEGQQRVLAELITSSMGLTSGAAPSEDQRGAIDNRLNTLENQLQSRSGSNSGADPLASSEYSQLLDKARSLWNVIEDSNSFTPRGGGGF